MLSAINVLADKHIYKLAQYLPYEINLNLYDPQKLLNLSPTEPNALLVRTTTKIDADFVARFPASLKFVATASAGIDHVDIPGLHKKNITFTNAPGCNARSVAEYVATALFIWADEKDINIQTLTVGIIGAGKTGNETAKLLNSLGLKTVLYDPPKADREKEFESASLNEVLKSDILTFHVPLSFDGNYATFHWLDHEKLIRHFKLIINASRGGVVDENALLNTFKNNLVDDYILDVWENEPVFDDKIAKSAFIHTPHIAGYSIQAKLNASRLIAKSLCNFFNLKMPSVPVPRNKETIDILPNSSLAELLKQIHPINTYHQKFSKLIGQKEASKSNGFIRIRTTHPLRNEFKFIEVPNEAKEKFQSIKKLFL